MNRHQRKKDKGQAGRGEQSARVTCAFPCEKITCNVGLDKRKSGEPSREVGSHLGATGTDAM